MLCIERRTLISHSQILIIEMERLMVSKAFDKSMNIKMAFYRCQVDLKYSHESVKEHVRLNAYDGTHIDNERLYYFQSIGSIIIQGVLNILEIGVT